MARITPINSFGVGINSDLTKTGSGSIDVYLVTETEKSALNTSISTAQTTANTALSTAYTVQTTANTALSTAYNSQTTANTALSTAYTSQTNANTALSTANTAQTTANMAKTAAENAQVSADGANTILQGFSNFYSGDFAIVTATTATPLKVATNVTYESISVNASTGVINFSFYGDYLISVSPSGDLVNSRTDWFQVFGVEAFNVTTNEVIAIYYKLIPPSMTLGIHSQAATVPITYAVGDQWLLRYYHIANGTLSNNPKINVKIRRFL